MATEVSMVLSLLDKVSPTLKAIAGSTEAFDKRLDELEAGLKAYDKAQTELTDKASELRKSLAEADVAVKKTTKSYKELQNEASNEAMGKAIENQENLKRQLNETEEAIKANEKAYKTLYSTANNAVAAMGKAENLKIASGSGTGSDAGTGILSQLGKSGALAFAGDLASQAIGTLATSFGGKTAGNYVSSALSSASMGAAIGSAIAPGVGTAIGAALGGLGGVFSAAMEEFEAKDDAYRDQVQSMYDTLQSNRAEQLTTGSELAAQREMDVIAFDRLLGTNDVDTGIAPKSQARMLAMERQETEGIGAAYLEKIRQLGADTPLSYEGLTEMSRVLATGFGDNTERMIQIMTTLGDAGSAVGIDEAGMTEMAKAMSRMESSGKATLEYLNIFEDRGIGVIGILSESLGKTQTEIYDMISKSEINGVEAVQIIQDALEKMYSGAMEEMSRTYPGLLSTLEDANNELAAIYGKGYNDKRKQGMEEQIDYLSGESGERLAEAYRLMGEFEAGLENQQEELLRNAWDSVMTGVLSGSWSEGATEQLTDLMTRYDEAKAEGNGEAMGMALAAAEAVAKAEYTNTEGYQIQVESQKQLVTDVQAAVSNSYYEAGYELGQLLSKGVAGGSANAADKVIASLKPTGTGTATGTWPTISSIYAEDYAAYSAKYNSHAYGLKRVPYDNYPALLHQDEEVLTAAEARSKDRRGGSVQVAKLADQIVVREEADIDRFAAAFVAKLQDAMLTGVS